MGVLANLERCNQDAANLSTVSGVSGFNLVDIVARQLPGSTIDRGFNNLRYVSNKLQSPDQAMPLPLYRGYFETHDTLFDQGLCLKEKKKALGRWSAWKIYAQASNFEDQTCGLRDDVQTSSDLYGARKGRRYTPSVHSVGHDWVVTSRPSTPGLPEATVTGEPSSSGQPESGVLGTLTDAPGILSPEGLAGRLLATVEEELPEDITQERIPLEGVAVTVAAVEIPDDAQTTHPLAEPAGRPSP
ncbi:hypothetical protein VTO73DRAFT_1830 [Trametes versicolor]